MVESVCQVERLSEVLDNEFSSIPVVNMAGRIIGMIPKNFVIVLLEQHLWYDYEKMVENTSDDVSNPDVISNMYTTALVR